MQLDFLNDPSTIQQVDPTPLEVAINKVSTDKTTFFTNLICPKGENDNVQ